MTSPAVSVLIPVYNEMGILEAAVGDLTAGIDALGIEYELVLCENGSRDGTAEIAAELAQRLPSLRVLRYPEPNYGGALRAGILDARGRDIVCFEIDFYDVAFVEISEVLLRRYDAVIGSKRAPGARDNRPRLRRFITWGFNAFLRLAFRMKCSDTHGIKAFRADHGKRIAAECQTDADIFTTELVIRMERADLRVCELPMEIEEKRPAPINIARRVPRTLRNMLRLAIALPGSRRA
ncbi:MAG: glycosyltransferase family 2 protein [Gammaproteobacteria bacterium]|nr:glycosyltransferase family 2 protein [Gammaproteobacteria bacterium]MCP5138160.1 glycosyltransferase family 2 protein [Gammaproteobacteria bacterium]